MTSVSSSLSQIFSNRLFIACVTVLVFALPATGQTPAPTSRTIFFNNVQTTLPPGGRQDLVIQLWDASQAGNLLFSETQPAVSDDANSTITVVFGSQTGPGLDPTLFPSGSSRYVDVTDVSGTSVLPGGRLLLTASPFALNPGPKGEPGVVQAVASGDGSIAVGGTAANPTLAVAGNGITNFHVANGALSPAKISGTVATLGANTFNGSQTINDASFFGGLWFGGSTKFGLSNFGTRLVVLSSNSFFSRVSIDDQGNVGINQDGPKARLEAVQGDPNGTGVMGTSLGAGGTGVTGTNTSATGIGVYGANTGGGLAGRFDGGVRVNGGLLVNGQLAVMSGVYKDGGGIKLARLAYSLPASNGCTLGNVTWTTPFADANYTVTATAETNAYTQGMEITLNVAARSAAGLSIAMCNPSGFFGAVNVVVHVIAIHD